ncbi:uracil-DNA glycosylase [Candidatus Woesearchaeota archaeon]|nr:uracil-DNA glycosylase [Candidatus Woesearchaeota archaeon]
MIDKEKNEALASVKKKIIAEMVCPLKDAATNIVFGKGNPNAEILFIGEAPGRNEDLQGEPFVGAAGKQLDELLKIIGLELKDVYIANILKYRPPENRAPTKEEIIRHTPYLVEQIRIIGPKIIITLGNYATKFVLAGFDPEKMKHVGGITHLHGIPVERTVYGKKYSIIPMYHPAAMLYNGALRGIIVEDFRRAEEYLKMSRTIGTCDS